MNKPVLVSVDLQYDFTREGGKHYKPLRGSVGFIRDVLISFLVKNQIRIGEIISDYRQPRPGDSDECCIPGTWGYTSEIPRELVEDGARWIKCQNSPLYTRSGIGEAKSNLAGPYIDSKEFNAWLARVTKGVKDVVLFGLTLDCCVLCTAQAMRFQGINVKILMDATDTYAGTYTSRQSAMGEVVSNWAEPIFWTALKKQL